MFQNNKIDPSSVIALVTDTPIVIEKMKSHAQNVYKIIIPLKCAFHVLDFICKDTTEEIKINAPKKWPINPNFMHFFFE